ncbi:hypothetical protein COBT_003196, partial [Conglomerata obtusa]
TIWEEKDCFKIQKYHKQNTRSHKECWFFGKNCHLQSDCFKKNNKKKFILTTDGSSKGVGAVLSQRNNEKENVIEYFSQ